MDIVCTSMPSLLVSSLSFQGSTVNMLTLERTYNAVHFEKEYHRLAFALFTGESTTGGLFPLFGCTCHEAVGAIPVSMQFQAEF